MLSPNIQCVSFLKKYIGKDSFIWITIIENLDLLEMVLYHLRCGQNGWKVKNINFA